MSEADVKPSVVPRVMCVALAVVCVIGLVRLGVRLFEVQVDGAAKYGYASSSQAVRRVQVGGLRGRILDRRGRLLADNRRSVSVICRTEFFQRRSWEATVEAISSAISNATAVVGRPSSLTAADIRRHVRQSLPMPLCVWRDVNDEELARVAERHDELRGFDVDETWERTYPERTLAAHVLGYVGHDRGEAVAGDVRFHFYMPELRGRAGLEHWYDSYLRGVPGERQLTVDARGFALGERTVVEPRPGPDLTLTLDVDLQRAVERQLAGVCGACAVVDPRNGEVLALASAPGFDPNDFVPVLTDSLYGRYAEDPAQPLLNRPVAGCFAPGSTFKPVTALAGLSIGYPAEHVYGCSGVFEMGGLHLRCARRWGHGELDLRHALMVSCNPFFCNLGMDVGTNAVMKAARAFGLGARTGIDLVGERTGIVPDSGWKMRTYAQPWYPGDLAQMAIGQGMLLVTPLQMALVAGAIGTGWRVTPHLKAGVESPQTPIPFAAEHLRIVREGMRLVVSGDGDDQGSGWRGGEGVAVAVAGKTGTAEIGRGAKRRKNTWFIAYAPATEPTVALALIVENGASGGSTAAPRAGAILRHVFGEARQ